MPVLDNFKTTLNFKGYISDGYTTDVNGFSQTVKYNKHEDMNVSLGIGDLEDTWKLTFYGRNLLEARQS